jgi:hypothetical protein
VERSPTFAHPSLDQRVLRSCLSGGLGCSKVAGEQVRSGLVCSRREWPASGRSGEGVRGVARCGLGVALEWPWSARECWECEGVALEWESDQRLAWGCDAERREPLQRRLSPEVGIG